MKRFSFKHVVILAVLVLSSATFFYIQVQHHKTAKIEAEKQKFAHIEAVRQQIAVLNKDYSSKQISRAASVRQKVHAILAEASARSGAISEKASLPFRGMQNVTWCVYARAVEIAFKKTDLQDRVREAMRPTGDLLNETRKKLLSELEKFRIESIADGNELRLKTLELSNEAGIQPSALPEISLHPIETNIQEVATLNALAAVSAAMEIALFKSTLSTIMAVVEGLAEREAALLAAAGLVIEVPIVDLIMGTVALGGTVLTGVQIYDAVKNQEALPGVIKRDINAQLDVMGSASRKFIATVEASASCPPSSKTP